MRLEGLVTSQIPANAGVGDKRTSLVNNIPDIKSGIEATYTASKNGGLYAREMTFDSHDPAEIELEKNSNTPGVEQNPLDSIASEFFASNVDFGDSASVTKEQVVGAYTKAS